MPTDHRSRNATARGTSGTGRRAVALAALGISTLWACALQREPSPREIDLIERHLALEADATVAEIGAGSGDHTLALARRLRDGGRIIATEIDPAKLRKIERRAARAGLGNVTTVAAAATRTGLESRCCDAVFMRGVYHHLTDPEPILEDLWRALRPGGRLLVIDFPPSVWLRPWMPVELPADRTGHGVTAEMVAAEAEAAGFVTRELIADWPTGLLTDLYGLVLEKPQAAGEVP